MKTILLTRKNTVDDYVDAYDLFKIFNGCEVKEITDVFKNEYDEVFGIIQIPIGTTIYVYSKISAN